MKHETKDVVIKPDAADVYHELSADRQRTLVGPEDDMWAAFADMAEPHAVPPNPPTPPEA